MNNKLLIPVLLFVLLLLPSVMAVQESQINLPDPGILPDSPFYFVDTFFDRFRPANVVADKRAAEIVAMAEKNHDAGMAKALDGYERVMETRRKQSFTSEENAEEVVQQSSYHLVVLARIRNKVNEQAKYGIDKAMESSAKGREDAISVLKTTNPEKGNEIALETLNGIKEHVSVESQTGLNKALEYVEKERVETEKLAEEGIDRGTVNMPSVNTGR